MMENKVTFDNGLTIYPDATDEVCLLMNVPYDSYIVYKSTSLASNGIIVATAPVDVY